MSDKQVRAQYMREYKLEGASGQGRTVHCGHGNHHRVAVDGATPTAQRHEAEPGLVGALISIPENNHPPAKPGVFKIVSRSKRLNGVANARVSRILCKRGER